MRQRTTQTHSWLFAFVDLAFLLLIVVTQIGDTTTNEGVDLGEIALPRLQATAATDLPSHTQELWQLRVHPPSKNSLGPFELIPANGESGQTIERVSLAALRIQLDSIRESGDEKPLLAPHRKSESQDLLDAVASLEELWPSRFRTATAQLVSN